MKRTVPNTSLSVEDDDKIVEVILGKMRSDMRKVHPDYELPEYARRRDLDWALVHIDLKKHDHPLEGDLYFIQHHGKIGDSGFYAFTLENVFKNRHQLDLLITMFESNRTGFGTHCADIIKGLRVGSSLYELSQKGILGTPPPSNN